MDERPLNCIASNGETAWNDVAVSESSRRRTCFEFLHTNAEARTPRIPRNRRNSPHLRGAYQMESQLTAAARQWKKNFLRKHKDSSGSRSISSTSLWSQGESAYRGRQWSSANHHHHPAAHPRNSPVNEEIVAERPKTRAPCKIVYVVFVRRGVSTKGRKFVVLAHRKIVV